MKVRLIVAIAALFLFTSVLVPLASAQEQELNDLLFQIQKTINLKEIPAYLENLSEEIRGEEESRIKEKFSTFQMENVALYRAGKLSQKDDEAELYLQALFQNSFSVIIENWRLSLVKVDGRWRIKKKNVAGTISTLYRIHIPAERIERVKSVEIDHVDIKLTFNDAVLFYDNIPGIETALLVVGKGRLHFSPSAPVERHQLELIYHKTALEDDLSYAFLRFSPHFFRRNIKIMRGREENGTRVSEAERNKAYSLFFNHYGQSFTIENSLNGELYSSLPQSDEAVFAFEGKKYGKFTYIYTPFSEEEIHLRRLKDDKIINLYSPPEDSKEKRLFISFGEMFDVKSYKIDIDFNPKQSYISGKAKVEIESQLDNLNQVKLKLNPKLEVIRIYDQEMRELFFSWDKLRELLYVYFIEPPSRGETHAIEIFYRGKIVPLPQVEDVVTALQVSNHIVFKPPKFDTHLFSRRSYWYPSPPDDDYFQARLRIIVPPEYVCVSNGELVEQSKLNGGERIEVVEKIGSSVYVFETRHQVKYLSFIVGGLSKVKEDNDSLPFTLYSSSGISYQKKGLLDEAKKIVRLYESKFGSYPYEKLSIVQRLWSTSGGHSPSSFIVLNELPEMAEEERQFQNARSPVDLSRWKEYFLAHEIAHQWWGQCVTWRTYHDQWLSEGLAQFASYLYLKEKYGDEASSQIIKKFSQWTVKSSKWGSITMGSRISFHNFRAYQAIIYDKASLALNMLKDLVGEEVFFQGLREFFTKFKYSIAGTRDFIRTMEETSGKDLAAFFKSWFDSYLLPEVSVSSSVHKKEDGYLLTFKISQLREHFVFPFWVEWMESGQKVKKMVVVDDKNEEFEFEMRGRPTRVRMNPDMAVPGKFF